MRVIVWHTPRTGSNLLMNLLHHTGVVGIKSYIDCGFFVGFKQDSSQVWETNIESYFSAQRTVYWNKYEIEVAKVGIDYFSDLKVKGLSSMKTLNVFLKTVDLHIVLQRIDVVAQAVSLYFAASRNYYSTTAALKNVKNPPEYDEDEITWRIMRIRSDQMRLKMLFLIKKIQPLPLYYEYLSNDPKRYTTELLDGLEIDSNDWHFIHPTIQKQVHPLKTQYIQRYKETVYNVDTSNPE